MFISWIFNLYNYYTKGSLNSPKSEREKKIRNSLEIGDFDKDLINLIVNLKSVDSK